jgi:hypothetical protein
LDNSNKEKDLAALLLKRDQMERTITEKDSLFTQMRKEYEGDKREMTSKLENYKNKNQTQNDEYMMFKLESTRESALSKQQVEFLNKKIEDLLKSLDDNQKRYEERLFGLRSEVDKDLNDKFDRLRKEKEDLDGKLLQKKNPTYQSSQNQLKCALPCFSQINLIIW